MSEALKLENQLCFPLYACSHEITKRYKPFLDAIDLTYTQYIAMMVMWEKENISVKVLGEYLHLDSGTLTPLLKRLESKGFVKRERSSQDERSVNVLLTKEGRALEKKAECIPGQIGECVSLSPQDGEQLYDLLYKLLENLK